MISILGLAFFLLYTLKCLIRYTYMYMYPVFYARNPTVYIYKVIYSLNDAFPLVYFYLVAGTLVTWAMRMRRQWKLVSFCPRLLATWHMNSIYATCHGDKIMSQWQGFSLNKTGMSDKGNCCCDLSPHHVATTCHLVCPDFKGSVSRSGAWSGLLTLSV